MRVQGNIINRIAEDFKPKVPEVGMGATLLMYSDRHAYTITEVKGNKLWAVEDKAIRTDSNGMSDSQSYRYEPGTGKPELFSLRKDGRWHEGTTLKGTVLQIGERDAYHDFGF
jgi:hypothetical protein